MRSMWKRALLAITMFAVLSMFIVGCGRDAVARVNGYKVTKGEYLSKLERTPLPGAQPGQEVEVGARVLQQIINEQLLLGMAKEKGVEPTDAQVKERIAQVKKRQPNLDQQLKSLELSEEELDQMMRVQQAEFNLRTKGVKISDVEVENYYKKNKTKQYTTPEQVNVALILTKNKADAAAAMEMLFRGIDFSTVARERSIHAASKQYGGAVPTPVVRGMAGMDASTSKAIFGTKQGRYTDPIPAGNGTYAIFKILKHSPQITKKFDDVKYEIRQGLLMQKGAEVNNLEDDLGKFRNESKIDVGIKRYQSIVKPSSSGHQ